MTVHDLLWPSRTSMNFYDYLINKLLSQLIANYSIALDLFVGCLYCQAQVQSQIQVPNPSLTTWSRNKHYLLTLIFNLYNFQMIINPQEDTHHFLLMYVFECWVSGQQTCFHFASQESKDLRWGYVISGCGNTDIFHSSLRKSKFRGWGLLINDSYLVLYFIYTDCWHTCDMTCRDQYWWQYPACSTRWRCCAGAAEEWWLAGSPTLQRSSPS